MNHCSCSFTGSGVVQSAAVGRRAPAASGRRCLRRRRRCRMPRRRLTPAAGDHEPVPRSPSCRAPPLGARRRPDRFVPLVGHHAPIAAGGDVPPGCPRFPAPPRRGRTSARAGRHRATYAQAAAFFEIAMLPVIRLAEPVLRAAEVLGDERGDHRHRGGDPERGEQVGHGVRARAPCAASRPRSPRTSASARGGSARPRASLWRRYEHDEVDDERHHQPPRDLARDGEHVVEHGDQHEDRHGVRAIASGVIRSSSRRKRLSTNATAMPSAVPTTSPTSAFRPDTFVGVPDRAGDSR